MNLRDPAYPIAGQQGKHRANVTTQSGDADIVCQVYRREALRCDASSRRAGNGSPAYIIPQL